MALRKEPERRYQSVEQFSEDIRRHLEALPVLARRDTLAYRAREIRAAEHGGDGRRGARLPELARRHRRDDLAGAPAPGGIASEKARAERRFNDVRQLAHSVLFDYHDAIKDLPGATRVRERLVKDGLAYLDSLARRSQRRPGIAARAGCRLRTGGRRARAGVQRQPRRPGRRHGELSEGAAYSRSAGRSRPARTCKTGAIWPAAT